MTFSRRTILFYMIGGPICFVSMILSLTGITVFGYEGFAVDNNGLLYVGENFKINVYDNGEFVDTIYKTTGGYRFTIQDEKICLATSDKVKIMGLSGDVIKEYDDNDWTLDSEYYKLDKQRNVFITDDARYVATNTFGFYVITKHGNDETREVIYHIPIVDFILYTARWLFLVLLPIIFLKEYVKWVREEKKKK